MKAHFSKCVFPVFLCILFLLTGCGKEPPSAVSNVKAVLSENGDVVISWSSVENADYYHVFRMEQEDGTYRYLSGCTESKYTDETTAPGKTYKYSITAISEDVESEKTESEYVTVLPEVQITGISCSGSETVKVTIEKTDAVRYCFYGETASGEWILEGTTDKTEFRFQNEKNYQAISVSGVYEINGTETESARSDEMSVPEKTEILSAERLDAGTIRVNLPDNGMNYEISRAASENGEYQIIGTSRGNVFYDEPPSESLNYYYRARAVSENVRGFLSQPIRSKMTEHEIIRVPVLMYHEFVTQEDRDSGVAFDQYAIWKKEFKSDLQWLKNHGYTTITSRELADFLAGTGDLPDKPVILSIDDGKLGVYKNAWPLLKENDMTAVLSLIGSEIDAATADPENRVSSDAPYCTWEEIREMADSGHVEMISHTQAMHLFDHDGRRGARCRPAETTADFLPAALRDYRLFQDNLSVHTGRTTVALCYPYSSRNVESDQAWLNAGYEILFCGNEDDVSMSKLNHYYKGMGSDYRSALTRRMVRMTGTSAGEYITDAWNSDK